MKTRECLRKELEAIGITGPAQEAILAETAKARHEWRVEMVIEAAGGYSPAAIGVLAADIRGVGGRDNCEGRSTDRVPALLGLGKGRKQAADGAAYTAAIAEALGRLVRHYQGTATLVPAGNGIAVEVDREAGAPDGGISCRASIVNAPLSWLRSLAREGLRRMATDLAPTTGSSKELDVLKWGGELQDWAVMVNEIERLTAIPADLHDYETGEPIRPASREELAASLEAAEDDGGRGVFEVVGRSVYVA